MSSDLPLHFEPYVHLAGLTYEAALLSWGGFYFRPGARGGTAAARSESRSQEWMVVDDEDFDRIQPSRKETIGERSKPYGEADVEVRRADGGQLVARRRVSDRNHVWVEGLEPDTAYRYRIRVDGEPWSEAEHVNWMEGPGGELGLRRSDRRYACRFRTHPAPDRRAPLVFAVLGDFGIGIRTRSEDALRQRELARGLERAVDEYGARLVLTVGDNIYLGKEGTGATGDEDDDWFFTFYQPYRYILDRVPFYPTVGNHDAGDSEKSDDRAQLDDNYFLRQRFAEEREAGRSSVDPGLFYGFEYGSDIEFVAIDTTRAPEEAAGAGGESGRYFENPKQRRFLEEEFPPLDLDSDTPPRWRFPFSHHPVYSAGPHHPNTDGMEEALVPLFQRAGVRLVLAGHEHNFQYSIADGLHYIVSGAGGKLRPEAPEKFEEAHTRAWSAEGHFLVVEVDGDRTTVRALTVGEGGELRPLEARTPEGGPFRGPIVVER